MDLKTDDFFLVSNWWDEKILIFIELNWNWVLSEKEPIKLWFKLVS